MAITRSILSVSRAASLRGLLLATCLIFTPWLVAQETADNDFSSPSEIEKRRAAAHDEVLALPADADPALRERLQLLEFACQQHLASIEIANKARLARDAAAQSTTSCLQCF